MHSVTFLNFVAQMCKYYIFLNLELTIKTFHFSYNAKISYLLTEAVSYRERQPVVALAFGPTTIATSQSIAIGVLITVRGLQLSLFDS
ncbi:uncharacterized protein PHALS_09718 [Plasmopara halstedii]|uniref:Uncharacterized protein n=1 Tax=Plasmopara halstedii TaxID=4781 RepID=A0A0P1AEL7_PLAHL|nr:uncharacterized protein PHALS_09718 [Plasmopara halstedii]CEG39473.1 hypothetical protein PHALS_09718 [Plasmopara halstedii]|eukprot:XP_024575842.1 hypothetical protein PHALS_09718 [Plasmopara halstedii]